MHDADGLLPVEVLASVLGVKPDAIAARQELEHWRKPGRRVERVTWMVGGDGIEACVKYGENLDREALAYASFLDPDIDPVLRLVAWSPLAGVGHAVATRWLPGRTPNFQDAADVVPVFTCAGYYAGSWTVRVRSAPGGRGLARRPVPTALDAPWRALLARARDPDWYAAHLAGDAASVLERRQQLLQLAGQDAADACERIADLAFKVAQSICSVPQTLDPGDFADENAHIATDGSVRVIDFDNARIVPVVNMLESVGENWSSQPAPKLVEEALRAFVQGWNDAAPVMPLYWWTFRAAHHSLRVFRKLVELEYSLRDLVSPPADGEYEDVREFAKGCAMDLPPLLETALSVL